ncbi:hypothetical protein JG687_00013783 [Phytophthora cactorum]|uniref:Uncharacterized protein n=1 Tax=Phytophthora cactorum TaxID=29920 RepID=A0A8T1U0Z6_9STRA|nr:hypothetical protein JG687_00013783 [Phytophthora cactorum]
MLQEAGGDAKGHTEPGRCYGECLRLKGERRSTWRASTLAVWGRRHPVRRCVGRRRRTLQQRERGNGQISSDRDLAKGIGRVCPE